VTTSPIVMALTVVGVIAGGLSAARCLQLRSATLDQLVIDIDRWGKEQDQLAREGVA
jgi:hypothetical protein